MWRTPVWRWTAGADEGAGAGAGEYAGQGGAALMVAAVEADRLAGEEARLHGDEAGRVLLVGHVVLAVGPPLDGVGGATAVDVLVLHQPGPAEEGGEGVELL